MWVVLVVWVVGLGSDVCGYVVWVGFGGLLG